LRATYSRHVLPPCNGLSPPPSTMRDKTPQSYAAITAFLHLSLTNTFARAHCNSGIIPSRCVSPTLTASMFIFIQELMGLPGLSNVSLPTCHGLWTPPDIQQPRHSWLPLLLPSVNVKTLSIWVVAFEAVPALQGARSPLRPTGSSV